MATAISLVFILSANSSLPGKNKMCMSQWGGQKYELKVKKDTFHSLGHVFMVVCHPAKAHPGKAAHAGIEGENLGEILPQTSGGRNLARFLSLYLYFVRERYFKHFFLSEEKRKR